MIVMQCSFDVLIDLKNSDPLSVLPENMSLTVLFAPAKDHKDLLKTRMSEMRSGKSLRFKMLGSINDLPVGMGKMTEALDAIDKMNKTIEKMNASIEGLSTENRELKKENRKMNTLVEKMNTSIEGLSTENRELKKENQKMNTLVEKMNTSIEEMNTSIEGHEKDIAKLSVELSEEKRCRSEDMESIRLVRWNSVTVNKFTITANICSAYSPHNPHPSTRSP
jgi:uncharacterized phage infection (PIP) family protein YhgE